MREGLKATRPSRQRLKSSLAGILSQRSGRGSKLDDGSSESGAILILALAYIVAIGLTVGVLTTWATNDLNNTNHFMNARSLDYAASSAVEVAINSIRYTPLVSAGETLNASPPNYCWGTSAPSSLETDGYSISAWCTTAMNLQSSNTRTVTIYACQSTTSAANCAIQPLLQAIVIFNDYPPGGSQPLTKACSTYCGEGATLESWDWGSLSSSVTGPSANAINVTSTPPALAPLNTTYVPTATATSGDTVVVTSATTSVCTVSSGVVSFNADGTCTIDFNDPGNINYLAAAQVQQSISVGLQANTITITSNAPTNAIAGGATYTATATAASGDTVVITSETSPVCTVSSGVVSFVAGGTCTLDFKDPGNATFEPAEVQQSFSVASAAPAATDVQGVPNSPQDGQPDNGDEILFTYNQVMLASSLESQFTGSTSMAVYVQLSRTSYSSSTMLQVCMATTNSCNTPVNLGTVNLGDQSTRNGGGGYYISYGSTVYLNATISMATVGTDSVVTLALGNPISGSPSISPENPTYTTTALVWTPSAAAKNPGGTACSTGSVTESGSPKINF